MFKKIFILVLTLVFCFAGTNVLADKTKKMRLIDREKLKY